MFWTLSTSVRLSTFLKSLHIGNRWVVMGIEAEVAIFSFLRQYNHHTQRYPWELRRPSCCANRYSSSHLTISTKSFFFFSRNVSRSEHSNRAHMINECVLNALKVVGTVCVCQCVSFSDNIGGTLGDIIYMIMRVHTTVGTFVYCWTSWRKRRLRSRGHFFLKFYCIWNPTQFAKFIPLPFNFQ